eukprot:COSAG01_NODE_1876_length_8997_cov_11.629355_5_plen_125_part_00
MKTAAGAASLRSYIAARDSRTMMAVLDAVCQLRDPGSGELRCRWFTALPSPEEQPGYYEQILRPLTLGTIRKRAEALYYGRSSPRGGGGHSPRRRSRRSPRDETARPPAVVGRAFPSTIRFDFD